MEKYSNAGYPLHPLSLWKILEVSGRIWEKKLSFFFAMALLFSLPVTILGFWIGLDLRDPKSLEFFFSEHLFFLIFLGVLNIVCLAFVEALITRLVIETYFGNAVNLRESFQTVIPKIFPLLWVTFLFFIIFVAGLALLVFPGLYFLLIAYLVIPIVVSESLGGIVAIRRSRELMRGEKGKAFGFLILLGVTGFLIQKGSGYIPEGVLRNGLEFLLDVAVLSYVSVFTTVLYLQAVLGKEEISN